MIDSCGLTELFLHQAQLLSNVCCRRHMLLKVKFFFLQQSFKETKKKKTVLTLKSQYQLACLMTARVCPTYKPLKKLNEYYTASFRELDDLNSLFLAGKKAKKQYLLPKVQDIFVQSSKLVIIVFRHHLLYQYNPTFLFCLLFFLPQL